MNLYEGDLCMYVEAHDWTVPPVMNVTRRIVARNADEAQRTLMNACLTPGYRGCVMELRLLKTNVPASKRQEGETLEAIKALVADLGPNSCVGAALSGCLELAEQNIANNTAYSLLSLAEAAGLSASLLEMTSNFIKEKEKGQALAAENARLKATIERLTKQ